MGKIRKLEESVVDKIAAGEVCIYIYIYASFRYDEEERERRLTLVIPLHSNNKRW